jgi:hypothetical protein
MLTRPRAAAAAAAAGEVDLPAQQELPDPMPGPHQIAADVLARPREIA